MKRQMLFTDLAKIEIISIAIGLFSWCYRCDRRLGLLGPDCYPNSESRRHPSWRLADVWLATSKT